MIGSPGRRRCTPAGARREHDPAQSYAGLRTQRHGLHLTTILLVAAALAAAATFWASNHRISENLNPRTSSGPERLVHGLVPENRPDQGGSGGARPRRQAVADVVEGGSAAAAHPSTSIFLSLILRNGIRDISGDDGADHLHHNQQQQQQQLTSQQAPLEVLDSCRRCAAFSASDFLWDASDIDLAYTDPDWPSTTLRPPPAQVDDSAADQRPGSQQQSHITAVGRDAFDNAAKVGGGSGGSRTASGSDVSNVGGATAGEDADDGGSPRRQQCREVGPFLGPIKGDSQLETYRRRIVRYIRSPQYRARAAAIASSGGRGILISAGGPCYTTNLIVTLYVLRRHFGCNLPVEVAWQGPAEMDNTTWRSLERHFSPIRGFDVRAAPHPVPELHGNSFVATSYGGKVYALLQSEFREVLMIDADSLPLQDPGKLFNDPRFVQYGSLFWPDTWTGQAQPSVFGVYGIDYIKAKRVLTMGLGFGRRDAESGQLLIDRARHLDVLETLMLINRRPNANQKMLWGDKDTFSLAFAAVGKAHCYNQVAVPPSIYFTWSPDKLLTKATGKRGPGWLLGGFLQNIEDVPYVYGIPSDSYSSSAKKAGAGGPSAAAATASAAAAADDGGGGGGDRGSGGASETVSAKSHSDLSAFPPTAAKRWVQSVGKRRFLPAVSPQQQHEEQQRQEQQQAPSRTPTPGTKRTRRSTSATRLPYSPVREHDTVTSSPAASTPLAMRAPWTTFPTNITAVAAAAPADEGEEAAAAATSSVSVIAASRPPAAAADSGSGSGFQNTPVSKPNGLVAPASSSPSSAAAAAVPSAAALPGLVSPVFLHRTINKLRMDEQPPVLQLLTAPVPQRWASYFLAHENRGPTRGVPWDYCVPESAIRIVTASAAGGIRWDGSSGGGRTPTRQTDIATAAAAASSPPPPSSSAAATAAQGSTATANGDVSRPALGLWTWWREERHSAASNGGDGAGSTGSSRGAVQQLIQRVRIFTGLRARGGFGDVTGFEEDEGDGGGGGGGGACPLLLRRHDEQQQQQQQQQHVPPPRSHPHGDSDRSPICPIADLYDYLQALDAGLPVDRSPALESACIAALRNYTEAANDVRDRAAAAALAAAAATSSGSASPKDPFLKAFRAVQAAGLLEGVPLPRSPAAEFYPYIEFSWAAGVGPVAPLPLPSLMVDWHDPWPCADAPLVSAVRASYRAYIWLHHRQQQFPIVMTSRKPTS